MTHILGVIFIMILGALPFFLVEVYTPMTFVSDFLGNQSAEIMGTMLAINLATLTFLVGDLMRIEHELKKELFSGSVLEIKHNIVFMFVIFGVHLFVLAITPTPEVFGEKTTIYFICRGVNLVAFASYIVALWEMTAAVFQVRNIMKRIDKGEK